MKFMTFSALTALFIFLGAITGLAFPQIISWGDIDQSAVPANSTNIVAISAGHFHNLSLSADGKLSAWPVSKFDPASQLPSPVSNAVVARMAAGLTYDLALKADGTMLAWGSTISARSDLGEMVAVAAGGYHCLGLKPDGSVTAWGDNSWSQISVPAQLSNVVAIAAGFYHSLALRMDGTVVGWGENGFGQRDIPDPLTTVMKIAAGGNHCLAVTAGGRVIAWGDNSYGQSDVPTDLTNAVAVAAGDYHSLALRSDGSVVTWGWQPFGAPAGLIGLTNAVAVAAGGLHSLVLLGDSSSSLTLPLTSRIVVCGSGVTLHGGLPEVDGLTFQWSGNGTTLPGATHATLVLTDLQTNQSGTYAVVASNRFGLVSRTAILLTVVPSLITVAPGSQAAFAGATVNLSVSALSTVPLSYQWRLNGSDIRGATNSTLTLVGMGQAQGGAYTVVLSNAYGTVTSSAANLSIANFIGWGSMSVPTGLGDIRSIALTPAQIGVASWIAARADGTVAVKPSFTSPPAGLSNVVAVAAGSRYAVALGIDGTVVSWTDRSPPNAAALTNTPPDLTNAVAIAAGDTHTLALKVDGTVVAWGDDSSGQTDVPPGLGNVVAIAAGAGRSLALTSAGRLVAWGDSGSGDPIPPGVSNVVTMALGTNTAVALRDDGSVISWEDNAVLRTNLSEEPASFVGVVTARDSVGDYTLGLTADGKVRAWGGSFGANAERGLSNVVAVAAAPYGGVALLGDGAPHIALPLVSRVVALGERTSFRIAATGALPLAYQWRFNGTNLSGVTSPVLTLGNVEVRHAGSYSVMVSNAWGVTTSSTAGLSVAPLLINGVMAQPYKRPVIVGGTAWLAVEAQGPGLSYQWLRDGVAIPGATESRISLTNLQTSQSGAYSVSVSNALAQAVSISIPLDVAYVSISIQPMNQTQRAGGSISFSTSVQGAPPLSYQWQFNGVPIPGATNSTLSLANLQLSQSGVYSVGVSNAFGSANASAQLTVQPSLLNGPQNSAVLIGASLSLLVVATGSGPFSYQWFFNGSPLPGKTINRLAIEKATMAQSGTYFVTVSNAYGVVTSREATLVVQNVAQWGRDASTLTFSSITPDVASLAASGAGWLLAAKTDGIPDARPSQSVSPPPIPDGLTNVIAVSAGWAHALALNLDGTVSAWGDNRYGQTNIPAGLSNVVSIAAGDNHSLALKADGTVVAWGQNAFGQVNVPSGIKNIVGISAGTNDSLAITCEGQVIAWGADLEGRPMSVPAGLTNVIGIASSRSFFPALRGDGTVVIWQPGSTPPLVAPPHLTNIVAIAANGEYDLELTAGGTLVSWSSPTNVPKIDAKVAAIAAGGSDLALLSATAPVLQVTLVNPRYDADGFAVSLVTRSGRVYALEYKESLVESEWRLLPLAAGNGRLLTLKDRSPGLGPRFYRVREW